MTESSKDYYLSELSLPISNNTQTKLDTKNKGFT